MTQMPDTARTLLTEGSGIDLSLTEAGASGIAYFAAAEALRRAGGVKPGATVLITGAAGGVGSAAAYLARWQGARVFGAVRGPDEVKLAAADGVPPAGAR